jgi:hypothetical protein
MRTRIFLMIGLAMMFGFLPHHASPLTLSINNPVKMAVKASVVSQCSVLDPLDACVQERFRSGKLVFGMRRIGPLYDHLSHFEPETKAEKDAIQELTDKKWQVAFFLAGRRLLSKEFDAMKEDHRRVWRSPYLKGPVWMAPVMTSRGILDIDIESIRRLAANEETRSELTKQARTALTLLEKQDQYESSIHDWTLLARPLRAREECLKCHLGGDGADRIVGAYSDSELSSERKSTLKSGDLLGAAIYAYRLRPRNF